MKPLEILGLYLGLTLNEDELVELQYLDDEIEKIRHVRPAWMSIFYLNHMIMVMVMRESTKNAYHLKREAKCALDTALANQDQGDWELAYAKAIEADDAIQEILAYKLQNKFSTKYPFLIGFGGVLIWNALKTIYKIDTKIAESYDSIILNLSLLPMYLSIVALGSIPYIRFLVPRSNTTNVLDAAFKARIVIRVNLLENTDSLIYNMINSVNNNDELAAINNTEFPDDMCDMMISHAPMTDPVYCDQSDQRFERKEILAWLANKPTNPATTLRLYPHQLKRDYPLKLKIDQHVARLLEEKNVTRYQNNALVSWSVFKPDNRVEIIEEEMIEEGFAEQVSSCRKRY